MKFLFLEPFFGGSHKDFALGLVHYSQYTIDLVTMPARFWKWRMRGAALYFVKKISSFSGYDGIIVTDLMSLADLKALSPHPCGPVLVYFHENQFSYPLTPGEEMDYQYGLTNITTALSADRILFNSKTHYEEFFTRITLFLKMMPEYHSLWVVPKIREKAGVLYPGCHFPLKDAESLHETPVRDKNTTIVPIPDIDVDTRPKDVLPGTSGPPLIIWNHRWEHDKNPGMFFKAIDGLLQKKLRFSIALLGEQTNTIPDIFVKAKSKYQHILVQYGYVDAKETYYRWLKKGTIVVSTALQENFGISIVEAIRFGNYPVLPHRLSYPELIPEQYHAYTLYHDLSELISRLEYVITHVDEVQTIRKELAGRMGVFSWESIISDYDRELEALAGE